jgi:hypothetical protein
MCGRLVGSVSVWRFHSVSMKVQVVRKIRTLDCREVIGLGFAISLTNTSDTVALDWDSHSFRQEGGPARRD